MKAAIYVRVSTADQNCEMQKTELRRYAKARGWRIHEIFEEKISGTKERRPELDRLLVQARERRFDVVLVWKLDRFARSIKSLVVNLHEFSELGVQLVSIKDQIDMTTATGRLMTHILGAFAEFEAALIKERVVAGLQNARRKGVRLGRPVTIDAFKVGKLRSRGLSMSNIALSLKCSKGAVHKILNSTNGQDIKFSP